MAFIIFLIAATRFAKANKVRNNSAATPRDRFVIQSSRQSYLADQSAEYYSLTRRSTTLTLILTWALTFLIYFFWVNNKVAAIATGLIFSVLGLLVTATFYQRARLTEGLWQQATEEERTLFKIKLLSIQQRKQQRYVFYAATIMLVLAIIYFATFFG